MGEGVNPGFCFSQSGLSAFGACRRRFFLRYMRRLVWPAALTPTDQWEEAIRRGKLFHHWVQQEGLGVEVEETVRHCGDALLQGWWRNYREHPPGGLPQGKIYTEIQLVAPLGGHRLLARFDRVILAEAGRAIILDWKTGKRSPQPQEFKGSWQTLVYRWVLVEAGAVLHGGRRIDPEQVSLVYWHAQYPQALQPIEYSAREHEEAGQTLREMLDRIAGLAGEADFPRTQDQEECRRCPFHSYCQIQVELLDELEDDWGKDEEDEEGDLLPEAEL